MSYRVGAATGEFVQYMHLEHIFAARLIREFKGSGDFEVRVFFPEGSTNRPLRRAKSSSVPREGCWTPVQRHGL